jgi:hypothetical protein
MLADVEYDDFQFESQPMCLEFHPGEDVVATGDIDGYVHVYARVLCYDRWNRDPLADLW